MQMLKIALVMIEHLLIMTSTQDVTVSTSSYQESDAFDGELLDDFQTVSLGKCLKQCVEDKSVCKAGRYNADSGQCQLLGYTTVGQTVTWLSDGNWTVFQNASDCAQGWTKVHESCYQIIQSANGRQEASNRCKSLGGSLAVISDAQEKAEIHTFLVSLGNTSTAFLYIDGSDAAAEGEWKTEAGGVMTYTGMDNPEPNGGTNQNCLVVTVSRIGDYYCTSILSAICEM